MILDDPDSQITLTKLLYGLLFSLLWALIAVWIAWRNKIFKPFSLQISSPIKGSTVLIGFTLFLGLQILLYFFAYPLFKGRMETLDLVHVVWFNFIVLLGTYLGLALYYFTGLNLEQKQAIFGKKGDWYQNYFFGAFTWFFVYPIVLAISLIIDIFILLIFHEQPVEQNAIQQFRLAVSSPLLVIIMGLTISFVVPIAEEFLFRGLLQSWLKKRLRSPLIGIVIAAFVFSLFHYSFSQGLSNIKLLTVLFLIGCFLGYLYEKSQSIWAPIGFHTLFNAITALLILTGAD